MMFSKKLLDFIRANGTATPVNPTTVGRKRIAQPSGDPSRYGFGPARAFYGNDAPAGAPGTLGSADELLGSSAGQLMGMQRRYAEGGKVGIAKDAAKALRAAIDRLKQGDHVSAVKILTDSSAAAHPEVEKVISGLMRASQLEAGE